MESDTEPDLRAPGHASPSISIVLPTLNERAFLRDCLDTLLAQDAEGIVEILVVDGGSTDATREVVEAEGGIVRLIDNPRVTAAAAMNVGIAEAAGDIICRADAHTVYAPDYVRRCVEVLRETGAANVGGPMVPVGLTSFGRAVSAVTTSPFGVGPGRFHYATGRAEVETVYLGCWDRQTLVDAGGYDEVDLQWAAEDQELNFRLRKAGGRIVLDSTIRSWYFPRDTPKALLRQYRNYGLAKASTLAKHKTLPYWRPVAPALLVGAAVAAPVVFRPWWLKLAPPLAWLAGASAVSARLGRQPGVAPHRVLGALALCHWGYGAGLWAGLGRIVTGRPFDRSPKGGR